MSRCIGVVTVARSDYGYYLPILRRIQADPALELRLIAGGMHLSPAYGLTVREIEADGFEIAEQVEMLLASDTPSAIAKSVGLGVIGFSQAYKRLRPDLLLLLGDRFEMLAAAAAALPLALPMGHIAGGELTEGAMDEAIRHSLTKMSHLHFVSTKRYRQRVIQMGEEPWRVTVSGAVSLDNLAALEFLSGEALEREIGFPLRPAPLLVTFHPETMDLAAASAGHTAGQVAELMAALEAAGMPVIFTAPNADTHNHVISEAIQQYVAAHGNAHFVTNLGTRRYFSLMKQVRAMIGNSSSGIIEAATFELPVVNIGDRQRGRLRAGNVLDVAHERQAILEAIQRATSPSFRAGLRGLQNPYGDGTAAEKIVRVLGQVTLDGRLLRKRFYDLPVAE
ncbi:MAG: UDP-N-acetylglucosamine 2-epimerase [Chloroflexi bacterium]|nr:UDP-N-acetylglucosamine 2-epimerase [Chloroflexota bacterium]MCI0645001.1 UDP-N-acetylglucosamine 2-epimerase [Chloroflexota bacterium]MCI0727420.1 UDP-N-acetylglucosamine 2-epimerase [Chloroflexota bacterium]